MIRINTKWYPYKEHGSFYRLKNGVLFQLPINSDGSMNFDESAVIEVDMSIFGEEVSDIINDLINKSERSEMAKKLGSTGGNRTKEKYGDVHYKRLAENMNLKIKEKKSRLR